MTEFDFSELVQFTKDIGDVPAATISNVRKAVEYAARETKDTWREAAAPRAGKSLRFYPMSVDYDMDLDTDGQIAAEVGPNLAKKQGRFGMVEEAPGGVRSAPFGAGRKAAKVAEEQLEIGISKAVEEL